MLLLVIRRFFDLLEILGLILALPMEILAPLAFILEDLNDILESHNFISTSFILLEHSGHILEHPSPTQPIKKTMKRNLSSWTILYK